MATTHPPKAAGSIKSFAKLRLLTIPIHFELVAAAAAARFRFAWTPPPALAPASATATVPPAAAPPPPPPPSSSSSTWSASSSSRSVARHSFVHHHVPFQLFLCWYPCILHSRRPSIIVAGRIVVPSSSCTTTTATDHIDKVMEKGEKRKRKMKPSAFPSVKAACGRPPPSMRGCMMYGSSVGGMTTVDSNAGVLFSSEAVQLEPIFYK